MLEHRFRKNGFHQLTLVNRKGTARPPTENGRTQTKLPASGMQAGLFQTNQ